MNYLPILLKLAKQRNYTVLKTEVVEHVTDLTDPESHITQVRSIHYDLFKNSIFVAGNLSQTELINKLKPRLLPSNNK